MKILITAGKTATALKVTKAFKNEEVILADYGDVPSINTPSYSFASLGNWNEEVIAHNLLTKALDFGVDMILPLLEAEITAVSKSMLLFSEFGLTVLLPEQVILSTHNTTFSNWVVYQNDAPLFSSSDSIALGETQGLNGVYWVDEETKNLYLMHLKNN